MKRIHINWDVLEKEYLTLKKSAERTAYQIKNPIDAGTAAAGTVEQKLLALERFCAYTINMANQHSINGKKGRRLSHWNTYPMCPTQKARSKFYYPERKKDASSGSPNRD